MCRTTAVVAAMMLLGCSSKESKPAEAQPPLSSKPTHNAMPTVKKVVLSKGKSQRVVLHEAKRVDVDGVVVLLKSTGYAHLNGDRNLSDAQLEVRRAGETTTLALERVEPGEAKYVSLSEHYEIALVAVDTYSKPRSATLELRSKHR